ncbi:hypothetical protein LINPERPRIM_LOCUS31216 [Linum perenne]
MPKFKLKDVWDTIRKKSHKVPWFHLVWKGLRIPKHSLQVWLIIKNRLATRESMVSWGFPVNVSCLLCDAGIDSRDHLFMDCNFTCAVMEAFLPDFSRATWDRHFSQAVAELNGTNLQMVSRSLGWRMVLSCVWKERCRRVFTGDRKTPQEIVDYITEIITMKVGSHPESRKILSYIQL